MKLTSIALYQLQIPCEEKESDGTFEWEKTDMTLVALTADDKTGVGYTYGNPVIFNLIKDSFLPLIKECSIWQNIALWHNLKNKVRNDGLPGIASHGISAVDIALWDLKAKILQVPLCQLWGMAHEKMALYGSGGFTSYSDEQTARQFERWQSKGISKFKMKVGRGDDVERIKKSRKAIGDTAELFIDANGAFSRKEALLFAKKIKDYHISWFEEPVSSDDVEGLFFLRNHLDINVTAGEYGYVSDDFRTFLEKQAVDVLQIDATRSCGYTGFFEAAHLSEAFHIPVSSHTAPAIHLHPCLNLPSAIHMEFFHDHVRIESEVFDGFPQIEDGFFVPYLNRHGHGLEMKFEKINALTKEKYETKNG